jgi:hypothetical protein
MEVSKTNSLKTPRECVLFSLQLTLFLAITITNDWGFMYVLLIIHIMPHGRNRRVNA